MSTENPEQETQQGPQVPQVDHIPETPEEVAALAAAFAEFRKEVYLMRQEFAAARQPQRFQVAAVETPEERRNNRLAEIAKHSHYCPGCGYLANYPQKCTGTVAQPHAPIEVVSTEELGGDPAFHTHAPNTDVPVAA